MQILANTKSSKSCRSYSNAYCFPRLFNSNCL